MRILTRNLAFKSVLIIACLAPVPRLHAQLQPPSSSSGEVSIQIVDANTTPVIAAEVMLRGEKGRTLAARTDSAGLAMFSAVAEGLWVITVRRIGVKPVTTTLRIAPGENRYSVQTNGDVLALVGVRVVGGRTYSARLDDFERRRQSGVPSATVSREQIERLSPINLSRMLRGMSGVQIADSLGNTVAVSTRGAKPTRLTNGRPGFALVQCVMRVSIDGVLLPALSNIDEIVPNDVHGIEVYFGPARMPPELAGLRTDNWCGLIAVWTRDR